MGDFGGNLCQIDISTTPPTVMPPVTMSANMALAGDFVAVADGTVFGTAYDLQAPSTQRNNILVKLDVTTGAVTSVGPTGYPRLYGASFAQNHVIGFTHDGSGEVVQIDPTTGNATLYATFSDPHTHTPIAFAGGGVSSLVPILL